MACIASMTLSLEETPFLHWAFTLANGDQLRVVPERGGLLVGWRSQGVERLYFDAERFSDPAKSVRGGIPVLFPVCGNLPNNRLLLSQGAFEMPQHGFARDLPWQLAPLSDGNGMALTLTDSAATRARYPFAFRLTLEYRLEPSALAIRAQVQHGAGAEAMPFALGLHPYLQVSALAGAAVEGVPEQGFDHLTMAPVATADVLAHLAEGVDLRVEHPALPRLHTAQGGLALEMEDPFTQAVIWTDPPRPMVCVEPWTAPRGVLGLHLPPGGSCELRCRYRLTEG